jgi:hypothetical protein
MKSNKSYIPKTQAMNVVLPLLPDLVGLLSSTLSPLYKWLEKKVMGMCQNFFVFFKQV